jgi:iron complex transport system substrate-binding protein
VRRGLLLLILVGCAKQPEPAAGPPRRVVSLLPAWTEIILALGAGDRIVACSEYGEPGRDVPRVDWRDPRAAETIARLDPDLVLRQRSRAETDPFGSALNAVGVRVRALPSETIEDVRAAITVIGVELGRGEEATALLARFDAELNAVRAAVQPGRKPRVLFIYNRSAGVIAQVGAAGPGSFIDELITLVGGENALADAQQPYVNLDLERLLRLEPDVVIDNLPGEDDPAAVWAKLEGLTAPVRFVRENRMLIPGPRLPGAARALAELIHGES